ncbi:Hypothetical predicted protein [Mytilus galloprovincialis]|uniref:IF rod domain-containing protein n=1 Tax=Mytilus galloprovincialis TaxID=29158 RepID=A0A8B6CR97_MYTGA|nr:Hypothetical predicted protein [Mytilus galloprovincialis]
MNYGMYQPSSFNTTYRTYYGYPGKSLGKSNSMSKSLNPGHKQSKISVSDISKSLERSATLGLERPATYGLDRSATQGLQGLQYSPGTPTTNYRPQSSFGRLSDKDELLRLNNRLSEYITRVRQLGEKNGQTDSAAFIQSIKILEDELGKLKAMYESELNNIRRQLQDTVSEKNKFQQQNGSYLQAIKDLENRLTQEISKNNELVNNINNYQVKISCLEQELTKIKSAPKPVDESPTLRKQIADFSREREDFKGRWEKEQQIRKDIEEKFAAYAKKAEFDNNILRQQLSDLKQRLDTSTTTIVSLESKIREQNKSDTDIPQLLRQVRLAAEEDMRKHQAETERKHNDSISTLRVKMESDSAALARLEKEKAGIFGSFGDLKAKIANLEAQVSSLSQEKQSLGDLIAQERLMAAAQLREMEKRLQDMQNAVFAKLQELNVSKESYIPLKAEIEAMKILLSEEEKRLRTPVNRNQVSTPYGKRKY